MQQRKEPDRPLALEQLRTPFDDSLIDKLPKGVDKNGPKSSCNVCGGYHARAAVHLDYVGHAAVTDRLLDVDPFWNWEPMGFTEAGTPRLVERAGTAELWIRLTIHDVTRIGVGTASVNKSEVSKELIGDAIRNAAMRFGVALDLWKKGEAGLSHRSEGVHKPHKPEAADPGPVTPETVAQRPPLASVDKPVNPPTLNDLLRLSKPVSSAPKPIWQEFIKELVAADAEEKTKIPWRDLTNGKGFNDLYSDELKQLVVDVEQWLYEPLDVEQ